MADVDDLRKLIHDTRELVVKVDTQLNAYLDHIESLADRMVVVEGFCEEKRKQIAELRPLIPIVFGTGSHDPGLLCRVGSLENRAVTWRAVAAISAAAGAIGGLLFEIFGLHPKG